MHNHQFIGLFVNETYDVPFLPQHFRSHTACLSHYAELTVWLSYSPGLSMRVTFHGTHSMTVTIRNIHSMIFTFHRAPWLSLRLTLPPAPRQCLTYLCLLQFQG